MRRKLPEASDHDRLVHQTGNEVQTRLDQRLYQFGACPLYSHGHAARVHDNVVDQPVSRALTMGAFGPVSVTDNRFASASSAAGGWTVSWERY
jgi:hypothetical protein